MELLLVCNMGVKALSLPRALVSIESMLKRVSLGSQAVSRELKQYDSQPPVNMNVSYMLPSALSAFELGTPSSTTIGKMHAIFAMPAPGGANSISYATGSDVLGNVLVPYFDPFWDMVAGDALDRKWRGWWDTSVRKYDREGYKSRLFSSNNIGVQLTIKAFLQYCRTPSGYCPPYLTDQIAGKSSFNTSYIQVNCSIPTIQNNSSFVSGSPYIKTVLNMTNDEIPSIRVSQRWNESIIVSVCNLTETKVQMEVLCEAGGCSSQKARNWKAQPLTSSLFKNKTASANFFDELIRAGGTPNSNLDLSPIDQRDIFSRWKIIYSGVPDSDNYLDYPMAHTDVYTMNVPNMFLAQTINSYLSASQQVLFNSSDTSTVLKILNGETKSPSHAVANFYGNPFDPVYRINYIWVAIDFLSCFVLLAAASAAVHLRRKTLAPDIFGYVSSMTRDNPQINLPEGGSTLSGLERARMLKKVKVKIADVSGDDGVGRVGLARLGSAESMTGVRDLEKGKRYV
jgi:hypothetical protein